MLYYFRRYPLSLVIMAVIFYLSFFTPPKSNLEEIPNIDKLVHVCMYGGLCSILWFEYLRTHRMINWSHILWGGYPCTDSHEWMHRADANLSHDQ